MTMPLSRLWLFFLTLLTGLLLLCLLLSPAQMRRSLQQSAESQLDLGQQAAMLLLSNSARLWVDTAAQLAGDGVLQASLDESLHGQPEPELLHRTVQQHLKRAALALKLSFVIVTDPSGRVIARAGQDEDLHRDAIDGYPVVESAVRGYRLDDLWVKGAELYRVAASPVIGPSRDRYVGAVVLGQAVGDELAEQLRAAVGMDVVFLADGKVLAASRPRDRVPKELVEFAQSNAAVLTGGGHSAPLSLSGGAEVAVVVGLPGEAAARGAALGLISTGPAGASLKAALGSLAAAAAEGELPLWHLPVALLLVVGAFLIGLLLLRTEGERPLQRLSEEVERLSTLAAQPGGVLHEPQVSNYAPATGSLAAMPGGGPPSHTSSTATPPLESPASPLAAPGPVERPTSPFLPPLAPDPESLRAGPVPSPDTAPRPAALTPQLGRSTGAAEPPRAGIPLPVTRTAPPVQPPAAIDPLWSARGLLGELGEHEPELASSRTLLDPVLEAEMAASQLSPPPELPTVQDIPPSVVQAAIEQALGAPAAPFAAAPRSQGGLRRPSSAQAVLSLSSQPSGSTPPARHPADLTDEITAVTRPPTMTEEDELDASFRRTYQEFIVTKQRCSEPVEGLTYDKFVVKLRQSREQIMKQHNCRTVRFHVYVKEGKAALKATPVTR